MYLMSKHNTVWRGQGVGIKLYEMYIQDLLLIVQQVKVENSLIC